MRLTCVFVMMLVAIGTSSEYHVSMDLADSPDFISIQSAIEACSAGDTIIVHPGTYFENIYIDKNLILTSIDPDNVTIIQETLIDGRQLGNTITFSGKENAACIVEGLKIVHGLNGLGAPIETWATISKCIVSDNVWYGIGYCGGIIDSCTVERNSGSGIVACHGTISNCIIRNNYSRGYGGGVCSCQAQFMNCVISGNHSDREGGGLWNCTTFRNCIIRDNTSDDDGGGVYDCKDLINCLIVNNTGDYGGAVYHCEGNISGCTIAGNYARVGMGGVARCDGIIENTIIWYNKSAGKDDTFVPASNFAFSCFQGATGQTNIAQAPLFRDTFSSNPADWDLHLIAGSPCIDAGTENVSTELSETDIDGQVRLQDSDNDGTVRIDMGAFEHSPSTRPVICLSNNSFSFRTNRSKPDSECRYGSFEISNTGPGILNWKLSEEIDWLTVDTTDGISEGRQDSACVSFVVDNAGLLPGRYEGILSITAPDCSNCPAFIRVVLYVHEHILVPGEFSSIQAAIDSADDFDRITVYPGTYYEHLEIRGTNLILSSLNPEDPNIVQSTVIQGQDFGRMLLFDGSEEPDCVITGFTITGGNVYDGDGGGVHGNGTKATLSHCVFTNNKARYYGDAIYDCDGLITDCRIEDNPTGYYNSGTVARCYGVIKRCSFRSNRDAGLHISGGVLEDCVFAGNSEGITRFSGKIVNCRIEENGNGISMGGSAVCEIRNCEVINNCGVGIEGNCRIYNCTIVGNGGDGIYDNYFSLENSIVAFNGGYGIKRYYEQFPAVKNCLFYNNSAGLALYNRGVLLGSISELNLLEGCEHNVSADPLLLDREHGDIHLLPRSPCIDAGNANYVASDEERDLDGNARIKDGNNDGVSIIDIGAYEAGQSDALLCQTSELLFWANMFSPVQKATVTIRSFSILPLLFKCSSSASWVNVLPADGRLVDQIAEIVIEIRDTAALAPGNYEAVVTIADQSNISNRIQIAVSLQMRDPLHVPGNYGTIQQAVNASSDHDLIIVHPGTYVQNIMIPDRSIVIRSVDPENATVVSSTILQKNYGSPIVTFSPGTKQRTLEGFTIMDGASSNGAGVQFNNCVCVINDCVIKNNQSSTYGGACYALAASVDFNNCLFTGNSANNQGGALYSDSGDMSFAACRFEGNSISETATTGYGGAIYNLKGRMTFIDCLFKDNRTQYAGGAVYNKEANAEFTRCDFSGNIGYDNPADGGAGCAVFNWITSSIFKRCTFANNIAYGAFSSGAAVYNMIDSSPVFTDCTFQGNQCIGEYSYGGAIVNRQNSYPVFYNCTFYDNYASKGGVISSIIESTLRMENCIVLSNEAIYGGAFFSENSNTYLYNCTLAKNAASYGRAFASDASCSNLFVKNSILWDQGGEIYNGGCLFTDIAFSDIAGGWLGVGNINIDPLFANISSLETRVWDVHLKSQAGRWNPSLPRSSDFNGDEVVNMQDFGIFAAKWLFNAACIQDLNRDKAVDISDLLVFTDRYFTSGQAGSWVHDTQTSPCIDAGNPMTDWSTEPWPHGKRINMGAYGGTFQSSMSLNEQGLLGDLNHDDTVNLADLSTFSKLWLIQNNLSLIDLNRDTHVSLEDLVMLSEEWLTREE